MSSMKKNVLAAALVAGMGMAGWAAAESTPGNLSNVPFQYGTSQIQAQRFGAMVTASREPPRCSALMRF